MEIPLSPYKPRSYGGVFQDKLSTPYSVIDLHKNDVLLSVVAKLLCCTNHQIFIKGEGLNKYSIASYVLK